MIEMKTRDLIGKPLNWAVAQYADKHVTLGDIHWENYCPSTDWAVGGPLVERFEISIEFGRAEFKSPWIAYKLGLPYEDNPEGGDTPLIAAMRCLVASRYGDTISIPKELL